MHGITSKLTSGDVSKLMKARNGQMVLVPIQDFCIKSAEKTEEGVCLKYVSSSKWFPEGKKTIPNERIDEVIRQLPKGTEFNYRLAAYYDKSLHEDFRIHIAKLLFEEFIDQASLESYCRDNLTRKLMGDIGSAVSSVIANRKQESTTSGGTA